MTIEELGSPDLQRLADPGRRLAGRAIDTGLWLLPVAGVALLQGEGLTRAGLLGLGMLGYLLFGAYEIVLIGRYGRTLGKRLAGLAVVRRVDGARPGYGRAMLRWAVYGPILWLPAANLLLLGVWGWLLRDPARQGLHDKAAGTLVVRGVPAPRDLPGPEWMDVREGAWTAAHLILGSLSLLLVMQGLLFLLLGGPLSGVMGGGLAALFGLVAAVALGHPRLGRGRPQALRRQLVPHAGSWVSALVIPYSPAKMGLFLSFAMLGLLGALGLALRPEILASEEASPLVVRLMALMLAVGLGLFVLLFLPPGGRRYLALSPEGLHLSSGGLSVFVPWAAITRMEEFGMAFGRLGHEQRVLGIRVSEFEAIRAGGPLAALRRFDRWNPTGWDQMVPLHAFDVPEDWVVGLAQHFWQRPEERERLGGEEPEALLARIAGEHPPQG